MKIHDRIQTGCKQSKCITYQTSFCDQAQLKTQGKTHLGFKDYKYITNKNAYTEARQHDHIHTEFKDFKIITCQKRFYLAYHLKQHELGWCSKET